MNRYYPPIQTNDQKQIWDRLNFILGELERLRSEGEGSRRAVEAEVGRLRVAIETVSDPTTAGTTFVGFGNNTAIPPGGGNSAPVDAEYLVGAANPTLTQERVVTDTATVDWNLATAGQAKADVIVDSPIISTASGVGFDQTVDLDNNARVGVSKNSGAVVGTRRKLNLIEGSNVTLTVADDGPNEEVDITIAAIGGGGGGIWPLTPIVPADFTWRNQGGASISTNSKNGEILVAPTSAGDNLRIREKNVPTAPYTVTLGFNFLSPLDNFYTAGLVLVESGSGKLVTFANGGSNGLAGIGSSKFNNVSSFNSNYFDNDYQPFTGMLFLQLNDDGTNRNFRLSYDGENFLSLFSVSRTDFITPDKIGFFVNVNNAQLGAIGNFYSWVQI